MDETTRITLIVFAAHEGVRLDRFCAAGIPDLSRNQIQTLNEKGGVTVNGRRRPDSYAVSAGEVVEITPGLLVPPGLDSGLPVAEDLAVCVVYEDDDIVVVNKPAGLVVHPAHGNWRGTLVNALIGRGTPLSSLGSPARPGVVHRLDKDTSGIMVLAKTDAAYRGLTTALKLHRVDKVYHAIVWGHLPLDRVGVDAPIGRHPVKRKQMAVVESGGKPAQTDLFVVDRYTHFDYIRVTTFTGRTHQIRVHLTHIGHPLLGDPVYGGRRRKAKASSTGSKATFDRMLSLLQRHALHASRLSFEHPVARKRMMFVSALPDDMQCALEMLHRDDRTKEV